MDGQFSSGAAIINAYYTQFVSDGKCARVRERVIKRKRELEEKRRWKVIQFKGLHVVFITLLGLNC